MSPTQVAAHALKASSQLIHGHKPESVAETLGRIAEWCSRNGTEFDEYGNGDLVSQFEHEVAETLGYPAARFMPSGTLAQQIALRIWAEQEGSNHVAMHPTAHPELHENRGYSHLHGLKATLVGPSDSPMLASHLTDVPESIAALLVELPTREAGALLPTWEQLEEIKTVARDRSIRLHLDGARLWECGPAYDRAYTEICQGFDSTYVSFYKGVGAISGAMLLGSEEFIEVAKVWQKRSGGVQYTITPMVASAAMLWEERIKRMPAYHQRAAQITRLLAPIKGIRVKPDPPHINMFHLFVDLEVDQAIAARNRVARDHQVWVFGWVAPTSVPGVSRTEVYVGEAAMDIADSDLETAFQSLMQDS